MEVELDGTWENSKHGLQLSVSMCKEIVPTNQAGILAYLSSGVIKGVGPEIAKAIVARFGDMCEVKAAKRIVSMLLQEGFDEIRDLDEKIDRAEKNLHQRLAPSQRNAVKLCLSYPISIMTGGPGSGKTTTLSCCGEICSIQR